MDKESLIRERDRQTYEQLRSRPRPNDDTPDLEAIFSPAHQTLEQGVYRFIELLSQLLGQNRYIEEWREVRTPKDHDKATGLDPVKYPAEFLTYIRRKWSKEDDYFSIATIAFSKKIFPDDPRKYSSGINYSGGVADNRFNSLGFYCTSAHQDNNLTLQEYLTMIRSIVAWREPRMISVGPGTYGRYDRVFWNRAWDGWIGWFPQEISPRVLPDFALTWRIGNGTAVATQETNVLSRFSDQKEKANELEIALVEAGILPTEAELKGDR